MPLKFPPENFLHSFILPRFTHLLNLATLCCSVPHFSRTTFTTNCHHRYDIQCNYICTMANCTKPASNQGQTKNVPRKYNTLHFCISLYTISDSVTALQPSLLIAIQPNIGIAELAIKPPTNGSTQKLYRNTEG